MKHKWEFSPRFRKGAYGWKSRPAMIRIREAVSEIKKVARRDPILGGEGAVLFLEKVSPAIEAVDSSSGSIGTAVSKAVVALSQIIAKAPADEKTRRQWLERLYEAHQQDRIPYIESLDEHWGDLCADRKTASDWADQCYPFSERALKAKPGEYIHYKGTSICLSALYAAERYDELVDLAANSFFWPYRKWALKALVNQGKMAEALRQAEGLRKSGQGEAEMDEFCEQILLSAGMIDEAYRRYGLADAQSTTYKAWFKKVIRKYPDKQPEDILDDLIASTPGEEGNWFASAKDAGLLPKALELAKIGPTAPTTLSRAARDFIEPNPDFALQAGLLACHWFCRGRGFETSAGDLAEAYTRTMAAAKVLQCEQKVSDQIRSMVEAEDADPFARRHLVPRDR
ncbi:MAG: hypothetical protein V3W41_08365 [Planctomycetota bacterium]